MNQITWTNPSVKALAGDSDPIKTISSKTQNLVLRAMDEGWEGPPFDPFWLAQYLGLSAVPRDDILDARVQAGATGKVEIEYNPNQPRNRIRFSVAHEIAHTLFPDYVKSTRGRNAEQSRPDDWQLELLCNISAAEILMPAGPAIEFAQSSTTIEDIMRQRKRFDVSIEALLIRIAKLTERPITVFVASREGDDPNGHFRIDYSVNSGTSTLNIEPGFRVPSKSVLAECSAIGYSADGAEVWGQDLELDVQCVGIPPYRGNSNPRVIGILRHKGKAAKAPSIRYLIGDSTEPRGTGFCLIAHVVNDKTSNWGRGFALAVARKWPLVLTEFQKWAASNRENLSLGNSHLSIVSGNLGIFHMIAQRGYGDSANPRIRYNALKDCLGTLGAEASKRKATVHMPRIGTGYARGNWAIIKELIEDNLVRKGVEVTVYDLPGRENRPKTSIEDYFSSF
jgi:O-acetyl-ADP-ribose deacetylase (regulator of RNase III)